MASKNPSIDKMEFEDLVALRATVDQQIKSLAKAKQNELLAEAQKYQAYLTTSGKTKPAKAGGKVAPKYRHPGTGKEWTGRGRTPLWIKDYEAQGGNREELAI